MGIVYNWTMSIETSAPKESNRREQKRLATAHHLASVAFELFERDGFDAVTMEQVADEADVARATLYNHFKVKEALLDHFFALEFAEGISAVLEELVGCPNTRTRFDRLFEVFADWCRSKRRYLSHVLVYGLRVKAANVANPRPSGLQELFATLFQAASKQGEIPADSDHLFLASCLEMLYFGAVVRWLSSDNQDPREEFRRILNLFFGGLNKANEKEASL